MLPERRRIAYIDGLRAVAVLLVVVHHGLVASRIHSPLARLFAHGNHGVDLFFVLSGFCLSYPSLTKLRRGEATNFDVVRYAAHRIVRIVPPYWIAILTTLLFGVAITRLAYPIPSGMGHVTGIDVLSQALFFDQAVKMVSAPFWTLPVEFRWYFLFPIMLWVWTKSPRAFALIGTAIFFAFLTKAQNVDTFYFAPFILGIVAADIHVRGIRLGWWPLLLCTAGIAYAAVTPYTAFDIADHLPIWYLSAFTFVAAAGEFAWIRRLLSLSALTAVGLASYSIYLVHDPIVTFTVERGGGFWLATALGIAGGFAFWSFAEYPFVSTRLRAVLIRYCESTFAAVFTTFGIGTSMQLVRPHQSDGKERPLNAHNVVTKVKIHEGRGVERSRSGAGWSR